MIMTYIPIVGERSKQFIPQGGPRTDSLIPQGRRIYQVVFYLKCLSNKLISIMVSNIGIGSNEVEGPDTEFVGPGTK